MALYHYKALTAGGALLEGEMTAPTIEAVIERLQSLGHMPINATEQSAPRHTIRRRARRSLPQAAIANATRELATLLTAKLPLDHCFEVLIEVAETKALAELLTRIRDRIREGATLAEALAEHPAAFSRLYVGLIRAGEAGSSLDVIARRLAVHLERSQEVRAKVISALIYPAILLAVVAASLLVLFMAVLPEFRPLFEAAGKDMPLATEAVMAIGAAVETAGPIVAILVVVAVAVVSRMLGRPTFRYRWDAMLLRLPLLQRLIPGLETARLSRSLAMLVGGGLPVPAALAAATQTVGNSAFRKRLADVAERVREGDGLARSLSASGTLPPLAMHLIKVGEETGQLEEMLSKVADIHERAFERAVDRLLSALVPVLTLALGAIVAAVIGSVLLAVLSVNDLAL